MKPHRQRIAIAKACGFKCSEYLDELAQLVAEFMPDYLKDLNAMHEAEKTLTDEQIARWQRDLWLTCENDFYALEACAPPIVLRRFISATSAQRAEAFLRTIGKWEEDE
jgi:hypothetical protein